MFDFTILQVRYVRGAAQQIASFRPDGKDPTEILSDIAAALIVRAAYVTAKVNIDEARATRRTSIETLHEGCINFLQQARITFRKEAALLQRLDRVPVNDKSFAETMTRADVSMALWADLPLVGSPPAQFTYGDGDDEVTLAEFTALQVAARAADAAIPEIDQAWQKAEANLHKKHAELDDFVSNATELGRSRYKEGTADREVIDAIPGSLPAHPPEQAVITSLTAAGTVLTVHYTAPGATSYDIFWRVQGEETWILKGDDVIEKTLELPNAQGGYTYEVMVRPRNSRGSGPDSEAASVQVTG